MTENKTEKKVHEIEMMSPDVNLSPMTKKERSRGNNFMDESVNHIENDFEDFEGSVPNQFESAAKRQDHQGVV